MTSGWCAVVALGLLGCGGQTAEKLAPNGQVVLYVTTDAPLPPPPGEQLGPDEPPPLFDRLRIDVFPIGQQVPCEGCSREFELDRVQVREGEASIGIVPEPNVNGYVARARLYRAIAVKGGEPPTLSTIDVYAALPQIQREGLLEATVVLRVDEIGKTLGSLRTPTATQPGKPDFSLIGTWPEGQRVPCAGIPGKGETCVPGGAFWMGHPFAGINEDGSDASISRLVVIKPFYADLHEATVADLRASGLAKLENGISIDPAVGPPEVPPVTMMEGDLTPTDLHFFCSYTNAPFIDPIKSHEDRSLNCISWNAATAYCAAQGKVLPSEAEFEYMEAGLRSDLFVWGQEQAQCGDSVWGRGGVGVFAGNFSECRPVDDFGGPLAPGSGRIDRLKLKDGEVLDLGGNVSEWTRDDWNRSNELCWIDKPLLDNPVCKTPSPIDVGRKTIKGGAWNTDAEPASSRFGRPPEETRPQTGFRCVRPAK